MLKKNKEHKILKKIPQKIISPKKQMIQKEKLSQELIVNVIFEPIILPIISLDFFLFALLQM